MKHTSVESAKLEPSVFGAVRHYYIMVIAFALAGLAASIGYTQHTGKTYQAQASITVPIPQSMSTQDPAQYLDSMVLLMESSAVGQHAASLADKTLHGNTLSASDFAVPGGLATITPPAGAAAGAYGSSIISVRFTASVPRVAQVGADSMLLAFDDLRTATMAAQFKSAIDGINNAIDNSSSGTQRAALQSQATQEVVAEQLDLAQHPTIVLAAEPTSPASGGLKRAGALGLVIGLVIGAAVAYVRALRRSDGLDRINDRQDPAALYGVPLIGEIPDFEAGKALGSKAGVTGGLPVSADPHSAVAEAFRFAAGSLERIRAERGSGLSLVFVSPLADIGKSMVVANLALAIAEGGTRVLAVDADPGEGGLTARLLPGTPTSGGLERALTGQQQLQDCIRPSPLNGAVAVLGSGPAPQARVTGTARSKAASALLATAKSSFDVVLINSPALLQVADATELVNASDATIIVLSPNELIRDHLEMVDRLKLIGSDIIGYIYNRAPMPPQLARYQRIGSSGRLVDPQQAAFPVLSDSRPMNGNSGPSGEPEQG